MKGLIFSKVTIEEQVVWPKADSFPPHTPKQGRKQSEKYNIYRITPHFLIGGGNNSAKPHWKEARQRERAGWGTRPMKIKTPPQCLKKEKKLGCLLLLSSFPPIVVRWVRAAHSSCLSWAFWNGQHGEGVLIPSQAGIAGVPPYRLADWDRKLNPYTDCPYSWREMKVNTGILKIMRAAKTNGEAPTSSVVFLC